MENQNRWNLNLDAVINVDPVILKSLKTGTIEDLLEVLRKNYLGESTLLQEGAPCRVLEPGKPWRKGKVRIAIEFYPEDQQS